MDENCEEGHYSLEGNEDHIGGLATIYTFLHYAG